MIYRRERRADAGVVGHLPAFIYGHVEIDSNKHEPALQIEVRD
jgi:hypothetical protein